MKEITYEFVELDTEDSFRRLAKAFGGRVEVNTLAFDNPSVKGNIFKYSDEEGLWIRKWDLTVFDKITLQKLIAPRDHLTKFSLIYFLNPSIFNVAEGTKKVIVSSGCNIILVSNRVVMNFSVLPKQPFFVLDITFTLDWFRTQFDQDADRSGLHTYISDNMTSVIKQACTADDYHILHELDQALSERKDPLYVRSRIYLLLSSFFQKLIGENSTNHTIHNYERIVKAENFLVQDLAKFPTVSEIAKAVNISPSSLVRQFKRMYGKSLYKYFLEKKMDFAKKLLLDGLTVNKVANAVGYKQASAFIETFSKHFSYKPGNLKTDA